ncbi:hypothetical protein [Paenibacillus alvei]|uniref:Uncharacterized protein n=1 Tax=Paenibacillus alvei TaxID=44250 RepID=A0A383RHF0_PAEAL|nr:hypothetical protein [Paenibacillus alvei]SYX85934.1 conserved protein of unknown function [Paenibacillus alvei]SYX87686.1 conserved protein of unknown function [Paenibacillus alvei]
MAIVKIELDLDWISEEGDLDSAIKEEVISSLQARFTQQIEKKTEKILEEKLRESTSRVTDDFLTTIMSEKINNIQIPYKSSGWSSEVEMLSVSEFVGKKYEEFLKQKVYDKDGNVPRYRDDAKLSIHEYFINKYLEKELLGKVNDLIRTARQDAEETIVKTLETNLKAQLSADIINRLNIPNMLKNLQEKAAMLERGEE